MTASAPFGSWRSTLSAEAIAAGVKGLQELRSHGEVLYWLESRPAEQGRTVLMARTADGACRELTPAPYNVRSRVHEYGGGAYLPCAAGVFFVNFVDQRIYRISDIFQAEDGDAIEPVSDPDPDRRFADLCWDANRNRLILVSEHHRPDGEPTNSLQSLSLGDAAAALTTLHEGHDFYAAPRISANGENLAFICWDHPNMPWDGSQLIRANITATGALTSEMIVAGGADESVLQPEWQTDDALLFLADGNGFWNLYRYDHSGLYCVLEDGADYGAPPWVFGMRHYAVVSEQHVVAGRRSPEAELVLVDTGSGFATPMTNLINAAGHTSVVHWRDCVACIAEFPDQLPGIVAFPLDGRGAVSLQEAGHTPIAPSGVSRAEQLSFPTRDRGTAHANYYPPHNLQQESPAGSRPPLLVMSHGGPTAAASRGLNLRIQYYTSRGWAVVDVDYRGSSGYGRAYRDALNGKWGLLDVTDCEDVVRYLADQGRVDPDHVAIRGGSAGGYTTLAALTTTRTFRAGASHYGIGDLNALARDTHKFESRYLHRLLGEDRAMDDRSPINHIDRLQCPVIFFQGSEDKVVPPNQSQQMVAALRDKGIPVAYLEFPGEGHGFRRAENIVRALEAEYQFFCRIFDIEPAEQSTTFQIEKEIENL
ncbi:MAG: prolyl oligopeptidase family serine peptidase [Gammaproteobacteria bacterium]|nr:prolyl oligopeptidase family serine peptidase [Gammaproteobacteria bacterium]